MKQPFFSFIIPTLNEEQYLPKLLESLIAQTSGDFEVIVVDGSSKDKTVAKASEYKKKLPSLAIVVSKKASLPLQRNIGAQNARGEWLVFVDADSILAPYFCKQARKYIDTYKPRAFSSWVQPDSEVSGDVIFTLLANIFIETTVMFKRHVAFGPMTAVKSDVFRDVGGYNLQHAFNEDVEFGLRLKKHGVQIQICRETLYMWSMRRIRHEGKAKVIQQMALASLPVILFKRPFKYLPGYVMGGQLYKGKRKMKRSLLLIYERKLKKLIQEFFS